MSRGADRGPQKALAAVKHAQPTDPSDVAASPNENKRRRVRWGLEKKESRTSERLKSSQRERKPPGPIWSKGPLNRGGQSGGTPRPPPVLPDLRHPILCNPISMSQQQLIPAPLGWAPLPVARGSTLDSDLRVVITLAKDTFAHGCSLFSWSLPCIPFPCHL